MSNSARCRRYNCTHGLPGNVLPMSRSSLGLRVWKCRGASERGGVGAGLAPAPPRAEGPSGLDAGPVDEGVEGVLAGDGGPGRVGGLGLLVEAGLLSVTSAFGGPECSGRGRVLTGTSGRAGAFMCLPP